MWEDIYTYHARAMTTTCQKYVPTIFYHCGAVAEVDVGLGLSLSISNIKFHAC